jgi:hypothetical protein
VRTRDADEDKVGGDERCGCQQQAVPRVQSVKGAPHRDLAEPQRAAVPAQHARRQFRRRRRRRCALGGGRALGGDGQAERRQRGRCTLRVQGVDQCMAGGRVLGARNHLV